MVDQSTVKRFDGQFATILAPPRPLQQDCERTGEYQLRWIEICGTTCAEKLAGTYGTVNRQVRGMQNPIDELEVAIEIARRSYVTFRTRIDDMRASIEQVDPAFMTLAEAEILKPNRSW